MHLHLIAGIMYVLGVSAAAWAARAMLKARHYAEMARIDREATEAQYELTRLYVDTVCARVRETLGMPAEAPAKKGLAS